MSLRDRLPLVGKHESDEEDVHDFLGVVQLDAGQDILVLPDHVAAILKVSGSDYLYSSPNTKAAILDGWARLLSSANMSVQVFIDRRPMNWDLPEGVLPDLRAQVLDTKPTSWQLKRLRAFERDIRAYQFYELRQYVVVRYGIGLATMSVSSSGETMYLPPPAKWRFWDRPALLFKGRTGLREWQRRRLAAAEALDEEVRRFIEDAQGVLGRIERMPGREMANLLHLLWRGDEAYADWLTTDEQLIQVSTGESLNAMTDEESATPAAEEAE